MLNNDIDNNKKLNILFVGCFLCFIFSFVSSVQLFGKSPDYNSYLKIFVSNGYNKRLSTEPFFTFLRFINDLFFKSSIAVIFFISAIISLSIKWKAILRLSRNNYVYIFLGYLLTFYWIHEYTQIRAACAISIYLLSLYYLSLDRKKYFFLLSFIAFLFHYSSGLIFVFYIYTKFSKRKKIYIIMPLLGFIFAIIASSYGNQLRSLIDTIALFLHISNTGNISDFMSPFNFKYLMLLVLFFVYSFFLPESDKLNILLLKSMSFGLCFYYWLNPVHLPVVSVRLAEFFTSVFIIWSFNCNIYIKVKEKKITLLFPIIVILLYSIASLRTAYIL